MSTASDDPYSFASISGDTWMATAARPIMPRHLEINVEGGRADVHVTTPSGRIVGHMENARPDVVRFMVALASLLTASSDRSEACP